MMYHMLLSMALSAVSWLAVQATDAAMILPKQPAQKPKRVLTWTHAAVECIIIQPYEGPIREKDHT